MTILNVAEKNDAAKAISGFLSNGTAHKKEGKSVYNKIYEFKYNLNGQQTDMIMTSVSGHMMNFEFPIRMSNWKGVDPEELFDCPVNKVCTDNMKNVKASLENLIKSCNMLIIWTDCDREGENIGMEIVDTCLAIKPNITVKRAKFSEITFQSVTRALNNLVDINLRLSQAVDTRQEIDLKLGSAFTRLQTLYLQKKFPRLLSSQIISYGSCQFPTMGFVVDRYKEVESFESEPFWKINLNHEKKLEIAEFIWDRIRLFDENLVLALLENITDGGCLACVIDVKNKPKSKWRPFAMDTIELEKLASRKLKINPKTTMNLAEKLYSKGFISYPRTETNIFPKEMNLSKLVENQVPDNRWGGFATRLLSEGIHPHNGKKSDQAHPPIHPLKQGIGLNEDEARIFELITRHFLACLSKDALGHETKVLIDCISKAYSADSWPVRGNIRLRSEIGEGFSLTGLSVLERNYLDVYPYDKWVDKEVPVYGIGEIFEPTSVSISQSETSAPSLLTEADLLILMDKHGIGTDATHAEHIEKVKHRDYVGNTGPGMNFLIPGKLGMGLVEGYSLVGQFLSRPDLRSQFEADLELICNGTKQPLEVLNHYLNAYKEIYKNTNTKINKLKEGVAKYLDEAPVGDENDDAPWSSLNPLIEETVRGCPLCEGMILIRKSKKNVWFLGCTNYPACKHALWLPDTVEHVMLAKSKETEAIITCSNHHEHDHNLAVNKISIKIQTNQTFIGFIFFDEDRRFTACLYCDKSFCEALNIRFHISKPSSNFQNSSTIPSNQAQPKVMKSTPPFKKEIKNQPISQSSFDFPTSSFRKELENLQDTSVKSTPVCHCGQIAATRKVSKEGPNKNKFFYTCSSSKCQMFAWVESGDVRNQNPHCSSTVMNSANTPQSSNNTRSDVNCNCGKPVNLLTVRKENQNKGRQFYSCSQCSFFQWSDEPNPIGNASTKLNMKRSFQSPQEFGDNKRIALTSNVWPPPAHINKGKPKSVRSCLLCRQPGHTSRKCPSKK